LTTPNKKDWKIKLQPEVIKATYVNVKVHYREPIIYNPEYAPGKINLLFISNVEAL